MIVVLTPNPAVDVTYHLARHVPGETNRVEEVSRRPGGKGLNVARVLAALGVDALALLPLGGEAGRWIAGALDIPFATAEIAGETRTTVTITDGSAAHPTVYVEPGPVVTEWDAVASLLGERLAGADLLVISGSLPRGADPDLVSAWVRQARAAGVRTLVDCSGAALLAAARAGADVLKPNVAELLAATGASDEAAGVAALSGAGLVVVSRGAAGMAAYTVDGVLEVPAVPGVRGNPTGAGDAATASLAAGLVAGLPLGETLRRAAALGAAAVLCPVAGEVDLLAYQDFLDSNGAPA
ncbi:tagatose 6-phosphate kinase [Amycolatopsis bartoniae]|uniref:Sugar kinase n=1 Tax=Amycolatopsis bartoniae TaxID=941986 RepID=A0A8H9ITL1_9PSEU|nr:hexose kinase [Amycolatopsis bartoniae]MBB2937734.1 tagatose 6-phosphate kinase [Amycolatopsis bartoniae]TVT08184.1 hexose kinase [Amycolatopsis bartoniae]GHF40306.1 sugar kinase [Amycolatopsis bartoniae]